MGTGNPAKSACQGVSVQRGLAGWMWNWCRQFELADYTIIVVSRFEIGRRLDKGFGMRVGNDNLPACWGETAPTFSDLNGAAAATRYAIPKCRANDRAAPVN